MFINYTTFNNTIKINNLDESVSNSTVRINDLDNRLKTNENEILDTKTTLNSYLNRIEELETSLNNISLQSHIGDDNYIVIDLLINDQIKTSTTLPYRIEINKDDIAKVNFATVNESKVGSMNN